jgi:hypothetical protein
MTSEKMTFFVSCTFFRYKKCCDVVVALSLHVQHSVNYCFEGGFSAKNVLFGICCIVEH